MGPFSFSTNYECATLVDGFDAAPVLMTTYNPKYYPALIEACGFAKAKDLWAFWLDMPGGAARAGSRGSPRRQCARKDHGPPRRT